MEKMEHLKLFLKQGFKSIKNKVFFVSVIIFILITGIFANRFIVGATNDEKQEIESLENQYEKYLKEYRHLDEYVERTNNYLENLEEIEKKLSNENILIYDE